MIDGREYENRGIVWRMKALVTGLGKPRTSREYKVARVELQRLLAPTVAIVAVVLCVVSLIVVTAVDRTAQRIEPINLVDLDPDIDIDINEIPPDPPEKVPLDDPEVVLEATETRLPTTCVAPPAPATVERVTRLATVRSPVAMNIPGFKPKGLGDGTGFGTTIGCGPGGGTPDVLSGCLIGRLVDFKRDGSGAVRKDYGAWQTYWSDAKSLVDANFSPAAMGRFFQPSNRVALTHLWVEPQASENGPKAFGAEGQMEPSGFAVYYRGVLQANTTKRYRFWGYFDDFMLIRVNGKTVMDAEWNSGGLKPGHLTGWTTSDPAAVGRVKCPQRGGQMTPGDWFAVSAREPVTVELLVGERPGGQVGGLLLIEEEGVEYAVAEDGTRVLPVFCSRPLSISRQLELERCSYRMSVDAPRFNVPRRTAEVTKDDVSVEVNI